MNKLFLLFLIMVMLALPSFAQDYKKIEPDFLMPAQCQEYEKINQTLSVILSKIRTNIKTDKYPKYYHDFTLVKDDGTQDSSYHYVKNGVAELIYDTDTNELKYVSIRRLELQKNRIIYDYPSGKLHAILLYSSDNKQYVFGPDGKYVNYELYVKDVQDKVKNSWKVPSRKQIDVLAKGQKDLLVQIALTVGKDGQVKKCKILKSSKIKELDENATNAIKAAVPFKPFPEKFFNEELVITLNFNFSL